jgi:hypothetical protein
MPGSVKKRYFELIRQGHRGAVAALPFLHDLWFERALPVPRHVDLDLASGIRDNGLRPAAVPHIRRLALGFGTVLLVTKMLGHFFVERGLQHVLGKQLQQAVRTGQRQPSSLASATIAAAAACSGDSSRPDLSLLRGLTRSDVIRLG